MRSIANERLVWGVYSVFGCMMILFCGDVSNGPVLMWGLQLILHLS